MVPSTACRTRLGVTHISEALLTQILKYGVHFCLGETHHYFNNCDLFCSFHAIIKIQFIGLERLNLAINNHRDNVNCLYQHPDMTLTTDVIRWAKVYLQEMYLVIQKTLGYLGLRMLDGNIVILTCLCMPTLVPPPSLFQKCYLDPLKQGHSLVCTHRVGMDLSNQGPHSPIDCV